MHEGKRIIGVAERVVGISLGAIIAATVLPCSAFTASAAPAAGTTAATSPKIRELMTSLAQEWLDEQGVARPSATPPPQAANSSLDDYLNSGADAIHDQIVALAGAIPALPHEFERAAARVTAIDPDSGRGELFLDLGIFGDRYMVATRRLAAEAQALLNIALFGVFGFGALWLFRKMTGAFATASTGSLWTPSTTVCVLSLRVPLLLLARSQPSSSAALLHSSPSIWIRSVARWFRAF